MKRVSGLLAAGALLVLGVGAYRATKQAEPPPEPAKASSSLAPETGVFVYRSEDDRARFSDLGDETPKRLVLLIHGLDEPGGVWDQLAPELADAGHTPAEFVYPNDQAIADSAELLVSTLETLREHGVERIDIVAHSMGGLVSRDALTRERAEDASALPEIGRLIMVGTPNHGSEFAPLRGVSEARERWSRWLDDPGWDPTPLFGPGEDGAGEAGRDLAIGSAFLEELNGRPLPETEITIIAGIAARLTDEQLAKLRRGELVRTLLNAEQAGKMTGALEGASSRLGDGVVTVDSAVLDGVEDVVVLDASHRGLLRTLRAEQAVRELLSPEGRQEVPPAIPVILDRLGETEKPDKDRP